MSSRSDSADRQTDVDGGSDTFIEQLSFQEDLSVSDGDDVSGDISGHITSLGFNDRQSSHGSSTEVLVKFGSSFKKSRVQIKHITRVSLSSGRSSQKQRHLSVGNSLLGKIVINDESMFSIISEVLSDSASGVRGQELKRSSFGGSSSNNNGVSKGVVSSESVDQVGDCGSFLTDGDVHAEKLLLSVSRVEVGFLVDYGVDGDGGLAGLSITNDELSLSSANGDKTVNGLETGLHRFTHGLSGDDAGSLDFDSFSFVALDGTKTINGISQSIKDTTQHFLSDGDVDDGTGSGDGVSFLNLSEWRQEYLSFPKMTTPTLSVSKLRAIPLMPERN